MTEKNRKTGFYCETCDCDMNDSLTYLDHLNGKSHNRKLGMNMKVPQVGLDTVIKRFQKQKTATASLGATDYQDFLAKERVKDILRKERK